jgi:hypothetical protein
MKKVIFIALLLMSINVYSQTQGFYKEVPTAWYTRAGVAITKVADGDTIVTSRVNVWGYDSIRIQINAVRGDSFGLILRYQYGDVTTQGESWTALDSVAGLQPGTAGWDTIGCALVAGDVWGTSFVRGIKLKKPSGHFLRFVALGTTANGRVQGQTGDKWPTSAQTTIIMRVKQ